MSYIRIMIADDHKLFRESLAHILSSQPGMHVVALASDGTQAIEAVQTTAVDVLLIDVSMPGMPSFDAAQQIKQQRPEIKVLFVSMHDDGDYLLDSVRRGASGYLLKDTAVADLVAAIREVHGGGTYMSPKMLSMFMEDIKVSPTAARHRQDTLTNRERQVLKILAEGRSVKEIAGDFNLSVKTVEAHKFNLMRKLNIHNKAQLVQYAVARKMVRLQVH